MLLLTLKTLQSGFIHALNRELFVWKRKLEKIVTPRRDKSPEHSKTLILCPMERLKFFHCVINTDTPDACSGFMSERVGSNIQELFCCCLVSFPGARIYYLLERLILNVYL